MKRFLILVLSTAAFGCGETEDKKSSQNNANNANSVQNNVNNANNRNNVQNNAASDLTELEWSMIGTWKTCNYPEGRCGYMTFETDRRLCTWQREEDNFVDRIDERQFEDWRLGTEMDEDGLLTITATLTSTGEVWDNARYSVEDDLSYPIWIQDSPFGHIWEDFVIRCNDTGTDIKDGDLDLERLGLFGNGDTEDTRYGSGGNNNANNANNQNNEPSPNNANNTNNSNNTPGPAPGG